jgi:hypothetical protein
MKNNFETRLSKLYENRDSINYKSIKKKIIGMTPEQREARIAELKKKAGFENLNDKQIKKRLTELKEQNKRKEL